MKQLSEEIVRTSPYWNDSKFANPNQSQCTSLCMGAYLWFYEATEPEQRFVGRSAKGFPNACNWFRDYIFEKGYVAREGAIACWGGQYGHVAFVLSHEGNRITVAERNVPYGSFYREHTYVVQPNETTAGLGLPFIGFLYNLHEEMPKPQPEPVVETLKVGDKVRIVGYGNANSYGTGKRAGGIGWVRYIKKIYDGRPYPYQVGNSSGTTGFYTEGALEKC